MLRPAGGGFSSKSLRRLVVIRDAGATVYFHSGDEGDFFWFVHAIFKPGLEI